MKKIILTLALVAAAATSAFAQIGIGAGFTNNSEATPGDGDALVTKGFYVEGTYNIALGSNLSIVPGIRYTFAGNSDAKGIDIEDIDFADVSASLAEHNLYIPVMAQLSVPMGAVKLLAFAGPTFQFALSSMLNVAASVAGVGFDTDVDLLGDDALFKRTDVALGGGVGVEFGQFQVKAAYDFGLLNRSAINNETIKGQQLRVGVTYLF